MDFGWNDAARTVHDRMRALGAAVEDAPPARRLDMLAAGGALGLALPSDQGGGGFDLVTTAFAYEGLGATLLDAGVLLAAGAHLFGVALTLTRVGTPEQKRQWLPLLASGSAIATVAVTEAAAGSDVGAVEAVAQREGRGFRFSGSKRFVTSAERAAVYFVLGQDQPASSNRTRPDLSALLVPRMTAGIRVGAPLGTAGLRSAGLAPVEFDGCEVGPESLLGRAGAGLAVFQIAMTFERALILAFRLGAMQTALDEAVKFARTREVGGTPIAKHQAVAHRIAGMKRRLEASRLLVYRAAWALDRGERAQAEAALAKWHLADAAIASSLDAFHVRGGAGFLDDAGAVTAVGDALGGSVHSGTGDVLASIVARWLGL